MTEPYFETAFSLPEVSGIFVESRRKNKCAHEFTTREIGDGRGIALRVPSHALSVSREVICCLPDTGLKRRTHKCKWISNILSEYAELAARSQRCCMLVVCDAEGSHYSKHAFAVSWTGFICRFRTCLIRVLRGRLLRLRLMVGYILRCAGPKKLEQQR